MRVSSKNVFSRFLDHLIERELLMTKNYFLAPANASFRLKNMNNLKDVIFHENLDSLFGSRRNFFVCIKLGRFRMESLLFSVEDVSEYTIILLWVALHSNV